MSMSDVAMQVAERQSDVTAALAEAFAEIAAHLGAAITQSLPTDDAIIMEHVRAAHKIATQQAGRAQ